MPIVQNQPLPPTPGATSRDVACLILRVMTGLSMILYNAWLMVRQGYPMVWRPSDVQYLEQRMEGGFTYQRVWIRDVGGQYHMLEYEMIKSGDGWQINGVSFVEDDSLAA